MWTEGGWQRPKCPKPRGIRVFGCKIEKSLRGFGRVVTVLSYALNAKMAVFSGGGLVH